MSYACIISPYNVLSWLVASLLLLVVKYCQCVEHLDVSQSGLTGPIPSTFGQLTNLGTKRITWLNWRFCFVLPQTSIINQSLILVRVSLSENGLTGPIPDSIVQLSNLVDASFRSNAITGQLPYNIDLMTSLRKFEYLSYPTGITRGILLISQILLLQRYLMFTKTEFLVLFLQAFLVFL